MILLAAIVLSFLQTDHEKRFMEELSFTVMVDGKQIELVPWEDEEEQIYYLFLPSGIRETNPEIVVSFEKGIYNLVIDGVSYKSGDILYPACHTRRFCRPSCKGYRAFSPSDAYTRYPRPDSSHRDFAGDSSPRFGRKNGGRGLELV